MSEESAPPSAERGWFARLVRLLALAGGGLAVATAALVTASVGLRWLAGDGVRGDFELVQMATALAVFAFMPLCQWRRGHVVVDAFSAKWSNRVRDGVDALWELVYAAVMAVVAWRLVVGAGDTIRSGTVSMVLELPTGWVIAACGGLAGVVALAALLTAARLVLAR